MANIIDSISLGGKIGVLSVPYAECSTVAATAAKVVTVSNFALEAGAQILVKFANTNTASNPTLNVSSTGAKAIYYKGSAISASYLAANRVYEFVYDGTNYVLIGDIDTDTKNTAGSTNSTSKLYLIGATSQNANPQTYSNNKVYISGNELYSNGSKVINETTFNALEAHVAAGTINGNGVIQSHNTNLPSMPSITDGTTTLSQLTHYEAGWEFRVISSGTVAGQAVAPGDWVVCINDYDTAYANSDWTVIQMNIDIATAIPSPDGTGASDTQVPTVEAVWEYGKNYFSENTHTHTVTHTPAGTNTATNITPEGTVTSTFTGTEDAGHTHTFTGTPATLTTNVTTNGTVNSESVTPAGKVTVTSRALKTGETANYIPEGSLTLVFSGSAASHKHTFSGSHTHGHTFTGTAGTVSVTGTPAGSIKIASADPTTANPANYIPEGTVSAPIFTGTAASHNHTFTGTAAGHNHTFTGTQATISAGYTPAGTIVANGAHTHTVSSNSVDFSDGISHGMSASIVNKCLTLSWESTGVNVVTSVSSTTSSAGSHTHTFTGTKATISTTYTPAGTIGNTSITPVGTIANTSITPKGINSAPTFTGTGVYLSGTFTGTSLTSTGSFTPVGTINNATVSISGNTGNASITPTGSVNGTFTGTGTMLEATFTGTAGSHSHTFTGSTQAIAINYTPAGTNSPTKITAKGSVSSTFKGTLKSHTHTFNGTSATLTTSAPST